MTLYEQATEMTTEKLYRATGKSGLILKNIHWDFARYVKNKSPEGTLDEVWSNWWDTYKSSYRHARHSDYD